MVKSIPGPCGLVEVDGLVGLAELPHPTASARTPTSELNASRRLMTRQHGLPLLNAKLLHGCSKHCSVPHRLSRPALPTLTGKSEGSLRLKYLHRRASDERNDCRQEAVVRGGVDLQRDSTVCTPDRDCAQFFGHFVRGEATRAHRVGRSSRRLSASSPRLHSHSGRPHVGPRFASAFGSEGA